eukprot:2662392-Prymnesium_polylepis.1
MIRRAHRADGPREGSIAKLAQERTARVGPTQRARANSLAGAVESPLQSLFPCNWTRPRTPRTFCVCSCTGSRGTHSPPPAWHPLASPSSSPSTRTACRRHPLSRSCRGLCRMACTGHRAECSPVHRRTAPPSEPRPVGSAHQKQSRAAAARAVSRPHPPYNQPPHRGCLHEVRR